MGCCGHRDLSIPQAETCPKAEVPVDQVQMVPQSLRANCVRKLDMYCLVRSSENPLKTVKPNRSPALHLLHSLFRVGPSLTTSIAFPRGQGLTFPLPLCSLPSTTQQSDPTPPRPEPQPSRVCRADMPCPLPPPLSTLPCSFHSSTMALASAPPCQASCPFHPKGYQSGLLPSKSAQDFLEPYL